METQPASSKYRDGKLTKCSSASWDALLYSSLGTDPAASVSHLVHIALVHQHVTFKLAVIVFKAPHGLAPRYLADDCQLVTNAGRHLRSSESATCVLQRTNTRFGNRAFRVARPSDWNSLPADLCHL